MTSAAPLLPAGGTPESGCILTMTLDAGPAAVESARHALVDFLAPHELSPKASYAVELVLEEVLMNIAWHAYDGPAPREARLTVQVDADGVLMQFEDDGRAFDPTLHAEPKPPANLEDARPGGLGLGLVRRFARHIGYQRFDGKNRLTITISRP
jgi:serine/threonine-protein kinase RsbW